jgi:hypothetical protein
MSKDLIINGLMDLHKVAAEILSRVEGLEIALFGEQPTTASRERASETFGTGLIGEVRTLSAMIADTQSRALETLIAIESRLFTPEIKSNTFAKPPATSRPAMPKAKPLDPEDPLADFTEEARKSLFTAGAV